MSRSYLIVTDSGGIQEEAPSLKKPVLVLRRVTERQEGVVAGSARLVGTKKRTIVRAIQKLLRDKTDYQSMVRTSNPYGDGRAARRITNQILRFLDTHSQD